MNKSKIVTMIQTLIAIVAGILLIVYPGDTLNVAVCVLGIALLAYGIISLVAYFIKKESNRSISVLIVGIVAFIAGLIVLAGPQFIIDLFPIIAGVLVAAGGVSNLLRALNLKKTGDDRWKLLMVLSVIAVALGILIFARPFSTMNTLVRIVGAVLIYNGIVGIFTGKKA